MSVSLPTALAPRAGRGAPTPGTLRTVQSMTLGRSDAMAPGVTLGSATIARTWLGPVREHRPESRNGR